MHGCMAAWDAFNALLNLYPLSLYPNGNGVYISAGLLEAFEMWAYRRILRLSWTKDDQPQGCTY